MSTSEVGKCDNGNMYVYNLLQYNVFAYHRNLLSIIVFEFIVIFLCNLAIKSDEHLYIYIVKFNHFNYC